MSSYSGDNSPMVKKKSQLGAASSHVKKENDDVTHSGSTSALDDTHQEPEGGSFEDEVDDGEAQIIEDDDDDETCENAENQLVLYDPGANATSTEIQPVPEPTQYQPSPYSTYAHHSRILPSVGAFTVQCANCFKWRLIPTKEKYEEIRENILQQPLVCDTASEWRPDISCDDPADINQDGSRLWAIDKPNIAQPPPGWQRLLRIRGEGGTRFADVYYATPSGKRLRSMVEIQKYLLEHPEYIRAGVTMSQFSFQIPKPLQEDYVKKRPARVANSLEGIGLSSRSLEPTEVNPLSWASPLDSPGVHTVTGSNDLEPGSSNSYFQSPVFEPIVRSPAKKQKTKSLAKKMYRGDAVYNNQPEIKVDEPQPSNNLYDM